MANQEAPTFSQSAIEALRDTPEFKEWNRNFEKLKRAIRLKVSPRDIQPLLRAGAIEDKILTFLAFVVNDSDGLSQKFMANRRSLGSLADQLVAVTNRATGVVNDPLFDERFWLAVEAGLSWDQVPKAGVIEARVLRDMRALAQLIKDRGDAFGKHSRDLKKTVRNRGMRDLIAYVWMCTEEHFDAEIAYLLQAAYRASGRTKYFTADQIKKFRQRHSLGPRNLESDQSSATSLTTPHAGKTTPKKTLGQRIAERG